MAHWLLTFLTNIAVAAAVITMWESVKAFNRSLDRRKAERDRKP
jgi:hypothetical protein